MPETRRQRTREHTNRKGPEFSMLLLIWLLLAALVGYIGRYRIMGFWGNFVISIILGPFIGALIVAVSADMRPRV